MIECTGCHALNPDAELSCIVCGRPLPAGSRTAPQAAARCPQGHPIDPSWKSCPYCDRQAATSAGERGKPAASAAAKATRLEEGPAPGPPAARVPGQGRGGGPRPTRLESPDASLGRFAGPKPTRLELPDTSARPHRPTVLLPDAAAPTRPGSASTAVPASAADPVPIETRPLVGVLAAPHLGAGGAVFAVRAGRNVLGSASGSDVWLRDDLTVSREHALLLARKGAFHLADRLATNGTFVNDREVPVGGSVELRDRDRVRCGNVELIFISLLAAPAAQSGDAAEGDSTQ